MPSHLLLIPNVESTPALAEALKSRTIAIPGADFAVLVRAVRIERQLPWEGNVADEVAKYTAESVADYLRASGIVISRSRAGPSLRGMLEEELLSKGDAYRSIVLATSRQSAACPADLSGVVEGRLPMLRIRVSARRQRSASGAAVQWLTANLEAMTDAEAPAAPALQSIDFWQAVFQLVARARRNGTALTRAKTLLSQQLLPSATNARSSAARIALLTNADVRVRRLAVAALGNGPVTLERTAARRALQDADVRVRLEALRVLSTPVLAREGVTHTTSTIAGLLAQPLQPRRARAAGRIDGAALLVLIATLRSRSTEARWLAACCLARSLDFAAIPALRVALLDESSAVSAAARDGLLALGIDPDVDASLAISLQS